MTRLLLVFIGFLLVSVSVKGQSVGDYQSHQTGNWSLTTTWEQWNGTSWVTPVTTVPTNVSTIVTIQIGHNVTLNVSETVNLGGSVVVNGTLTFSGSLPIKILTINGSLSNNGSMVSPSSAKLKFNAGSNYFHQFSDGGIIPAAQWDPASTVNIVGYASGMSNQPTGLNQTFGNFVWNSPNQDQLINLGGLPTNVQGDFNVIDAGNSSGTGAIYYSFGGSGGYTLNVGGNFNISSVFGFTSGDAAASTLNVTGNINISGTSGYCQFGDDQNNIVNCSGNFNVTGSATVDFSATNAVTNFNLIGDYTQSGTSVISASGGMGTGNINFSGTSGTSQNFNSTIVPTGNVNYSVATLSILNVTNSNFVGGGGTFTLNGTLQVGSTASGGALQTGTAAGNIRVSGARTYASNSTIIYNGLGAQFIGNGFPSGSNVNLTINNSSGVTLSSNLSIVALQLLKLTSGNISIGAQTLTINGAVSGAGGIVGGATSNLTIGGTGDFGTLTFNGTNQLFNFTLNRTGSGLVTLGGDLDIKGTFTHTAGTLAVGSHTLTVSGAWGPATPDDLSVTGSSVIVVDGSGTLPTDFGFDPGSTALGTLTLNRASSTLATSSSITITNLNLTSGIFSNGSGITMATGGTITRSGGSISMNPTNTGNSYNVVYASSGTLTTGPELPSSTTALANLSKTGSSTLTLGSNITVNGILTLSNGSFNAGSNSINLKGNFVSAAASTLTSSTITFSGTTTLSGSSAPVFGNITVTGSLTPSSNFQVNGNLVNNGTLNAGSAATTFGGTTTISGSSTSSFNNVIISGTLKAPATTVNVAGDFTNNGTFNHNNGSVTFNGTTAILGSATTSLYGVNITGSLTAPSTTLNIAGNWATTGTFVNNGGKVLLNGTVAAQSVTGSVNLQDIDITNPTGVNNNGTINLNGTLTLASAAALFDADGSGSGILTIKSTAVNAGGRIAALPTPANFSGLVTVERFINGPDTWRYLSMPLTNGNVGKWKANFPVTGNFSDPSPVGVNGVISSSDPSIYFWNATTQAFAAVGSGTSTTATLLSNLTGYSAYSYISSNFIASVRGNIRTGNATVPSLSTSGFNLVPNPYPSPIDWDNMNRTGLNNTISLRVSDNVFASYVAGGLATNAPFVGWTGEVAIGQSFWIQSTGATSLNLTESAKTGNAYQFLRQEDPRNYVRVVLSSDKQRDETLVWFNENATTGFDDQYDARKMRNGYFTPTQIKNSYLNVSTFLGDTTTEYAINSMSKLKCNNTIGMKVTDVAPGEYTLSFENLETMDLGYQVILVDHFTKVEKQVDSNLTYTFNVTSDKSTFGTSRFELRFLMPGSTWINSQQPPKTFITDPCDFKLLGISIDSQSGATYQFFKDTVSVSDVLIGSGAAMTVSVPKSQLDLGSNKLSLRVAAQSGCDSYLFAEAISYDYQVLNPVAISRNGLTLKSSSEDGNQWFQNGVAIDGAVGTQLNVQESATYTVQVTKGECTVSSEIDVDITTDLIQVFPVPTDGKVNLILPKQINASLTGISIYDVRGVNILEIQSSQALLSNEVKTLDLSGLSTGVYLLQIKADQIYVVKVVKK